MHQNPDYPYRDDAVDYSPARVNHPNVSTVSAYREGDEFAENFDCGPGCDAGSNFGNPPIEYSGPGEDVPSLRVGGGSGMGFPGVGTEDGTSYAAPHIAGMLLAAPNRFQLNGTVSNDPDGNPDPIAVTDSEFGVDVSDPGSLASGETGTWTAHVYNAGGPVSYQWYTQAVGSDTWNARGGNRTMSTAFVNQIEPLTVRTAQIKVTVSNASETVTVYGNVYIDPAPPYPCNFSITTSTDSVTTNRPPPPGCD